MARFLELVKLAGADPGVERGAGRRLTGGDQRPARARRSRPSSARRCATRASTPTCSTRRARPSGGRELIAQRDEPSLEAFLPRRGEGLALSATDIELYRTCPLKYKFARVFGIPQETTINQRFGIVIHQVLERFHGSTQPRRIRRRTSDPGSLERLMALFAAAWRRSGFGESDDELQFREQAIEALHRYHAREVASGSQPALGRAQVRLPDRAPPPARPRGPRRRAARAAATS